MSLLQPKLNSYYGFGIFVASGPSVADPAMLYKYIITVSFWKWTKHFYIGGQ